MRFRCDREQILKEISTAQEIISSRNALSILSNVLLQAEDGHLTIRATDLKVSFETSIPVDIETPGKTTVFCDRLLGILRSLPQGDIGFDEAKEGVFTIRPAAKKIGFQLKSISPDKFPQIQLASDDQYFEFPQTDLIEMIGQTVFAVSDDETRHFMNGVYVERVDNTLVMVGTDGRRLAYVKRPLDASVGVSGVIIPPKILHLIRKLASGEGPIQMALTDKNVFVRFDNRNISSALIEGQFPNYQRVIPSSQEYCLVIDRAALSEATRRVSLLVEKSRRLYIAVAEGTMILRAEESDIGEAEEEVPCEYQGPETSFAVNYTYLSDPLRVIPGDRIRIEFSAPNKAIGLYSVDDDQVFHIVMPMQLD